MVLEKRDFMPESGNVDTYDLYTVNGENENAYSSKR